MLKLAELNSLEPENFTSTLGGIFEHSPWVAAKTADKRPFPTLDHLHAALCKTVTDATEGEKLALIRAHPDLATRHSVSRESGREQTNAGLTELSSLEADQFQQYNSHYRDRFGFPFVICARLNNKQAMLDAMAIRLQNSKSDEMEIALKEIYKIARLRLDDLVER